MAFSILGQADAPHANTETTREAAEQAAAAFPALLVEAERVAQTVAHGVHGRRRSGTGESFWQYKHYCYGDSVSSIDWRRSARSDDIYIRQNEWEAANTVWLWPCLNPCMKFKSYLAPVSKRDRAVLISLALSYLLLQAGERVGILGSSVPPSQHRTAMSRLAGYFTHDMGDEGTLPPMIQVSKFSTLVLAGDFLDPLDEIADCFGQLAGRNIQGHVVQVLDPAEETLPYKGRKEFTEIAGPLKLTIGKVEGLCGEYHKKLAEHRHELSAICQRLGWTFAVHHTDASPHQALLSLYGHLSGDRAKGRAATVGG